MFEQYFLQISPNSEMVELESFRKFVELIQNDPTSKLISFNDRNTCSQK